MEDGARHATGRAVARTLVPATIAFASLAWGVSQIAAANRARHLRSFEGVSPDSESALFGHVLGQTAVFAAVLTLVVVLVLGRRAMYALVAAGGLLLSILASAGPLSLLPGTLWAGQDTFAATAGWRALVAGAVCLVMVAAVVTLRLLLARTPQGVEPAAGAGQAGQAGRPGRREAALVCVAYLACFGLWGLLQPDAWVDDANPIPESVPMTISFALLGVAAAVAGARLRLRGVLALALTLAIAGLTLWYVYHRPGGAPEAYGWGVVGEEIPAFGIRDLALAVVLAVPFGATLTTAGRRATLAGRSMALRLSAGVSA